MYPGDGADGVSYIGEVAEFGDGGVVGSPEVYTSAETDAEDVCCAPVYEIEIKIVC